MNASDRVGLILGLGLGLLNMGLRVYVGLLNPALGLVSDKVAIIRDEGFGRSANSRILSRGCCARSGSIDRGGYTVTRAVHR